jgi:hypothetical protein
MPRRFEVRFVLEIDKPHNPERHLALNTGMASAVPAVL